MNQLQIFKNSEFGEVRTISENNNPMFCLTDLCVILDIKNSRDCKNRLNVDGVVTADIIDRMGRTQSATFVNESNLYKVIFQSRKESAERFTEWVTSEVLPSIRKHGMYAVDELLENPDLLIKVATELKNEREKNQLLQSDVKRMRPKEIFADAVSVSHTSILIGELAKILKQNGVSIGQNRLFEWLRSNSYLISRCGIDYNMPTQKSMELGLFEIKERTINNPDGSVRITKTVLVNGKGQQYFINKFLS